MGFGASPVRTSVASFPAGGFFFVLNVTFAEKHDFSMIFLKNDYNLSSNRGTINETGMLDPIEFWWVA